jgi:hypothetical protein
VPSNHTSRNAVLPRSGLVEDDQPVPGVQLRIVSDPEIDVAVMGDSEDQHPRLRSRGAQRVVGERLVDDLLLDLATVWPTSSLADSV